MWSSPFPSAKVLIVDDEQDSVGLLEPMLREAGAGQLTSKSTTDPRRALPLYEEFQPDLILLDLQMPHLDGFEVMRQLQARVPKDVYLPILVLTGDISDQAKKKGPIPRRKGFSDQALRPRRNSSPHQQSCGGWFEIRVTGPSSSGCRPWREIPNGGR